MNRRERPALHRSAGRLLATGGADIPSGRCAPDMESVTGIGGLFFRAKDPDALAKWYRDTLGVALVPENYEQSPWTQEAGPTAFTPFPQESEYFPRDRVWMINFRVRDLDAIVAQLRAAGVLVTIDPEPYPIGRFARLADPDGNPIELWEPKPTTAATGTP